MISITKPAVYSVLNLCNLTFHINSSAGYNYSLPFWRSAQCIIWK